MNQHYSQTAESTESRNDIITVKLVTIHICSEFLTPFNIVVKGPKLNGSRVLLSKLLPALKRLGGALVYKIHRCFFLGGQKHTIESSITICSQYLMPSFNLLIREVSGLRKFFGIFETTVFLTDRSDVLQVSL